ncbi:MAG: hypothetical protein H7Y02_01400, partial [Candidatus Obscuribacterales bacterium]|nr:hypothetical protein [Steroidobacteraceae bacterium]
MLTATAAAQSASQSGAERQLAFRGFQIDARALSEEQFKRVLPAIKQQILVVESVGLRKVALEFLRNIPLEIDPRLHGNTGVYFANGEYGEIKLQAVAFSDKQPILLHELLHGYHFKILKVDRP